jgi:hypothetical protein
MAILKARSCRAGKWGISAFRDTPAPILREIGDWKHLEAAEGVGYFLVGTEESLTFVADTLLCEEGCTAVSSVLRTWSPFSR